jgi:hypothetical protein
MPSLTAPAAKVSRCEHVSCCEKSHENALQPSATANVKPSEKLPTDRFLRPAGPSNAEDADGKQSRAFDEVNRGERQNSVIRSKRDKNLF